MSDAVTIGAVMSRDPVTIDEAESLEQAEELFDRHRVRHLPVTRRGRLVGVVSDRDVKLAWGTLRARAEELTVADIARQEVHRVDADEPLWQVAETMARRHIGSAVVVEGERVIGIFTTSDACRLLASRLRDPE